MMRIPIVFAFDDNLILQAAVCISSLLEHAHDNTYYDIYILHPRESDMQNSIIQKLHEKYDRFSLSFIHVESIFEKSYEVRGITSPTYYRLLIPTILPNENKLFYSDVDIIFRTDLSDVFDIDLSNEYLAATFDLGMILTEDGQKHISKIGLKDKNKYLQAGFLLMNTRKMREDAVVDRFIKLSKNKYQFQDQDILNIVCDGKYKLLPIMYNMTDYVFMFLHQKHEYFKNLSETEILDALKRGTLHYNGHKPWKKYSLNFDVWWEYYRMSPVFNYDLYYQFFYQKKDLFDRLPLYKRIKVLMRFFIYGRIK